MKNKLFLLAFSVVMAASLCVFTGCQNDVQEIEGNVGIISPGANPVASVTPKKEALGIGTTTHNYIFLSWDAVDNVSGYIIYYQQEGKKTVTVSQYMGPFTQSPGNVFDSTSISESSPIKTNGTTPDIDKIIAYAKFSSVTGNNTTPGSFLLGKKYRFGIQTMPIQGNSTNYSNIVWSEYIQL